MTQDDGKLFDVRTLARKLRRGVVTKKDYEEYLKSLPDKAGNAEPAPFTRSTDDDGDN